MINYFLYAVNQGADTLSCFKVDISTGTLESLSPFNYSTGDQPNSVDIDTSGNYLYVVNSGTKNVSMFSINQGTGALTSNGVTAAESSTPIAGVTSKDTPASSYFFMTITTPENVVKTFSISGGILSPGASVSAELNPYGVIVEPQNRYLYCANNSSKSVSGFSGVASGTLTSIGTEEADLYPNQLAVTPLTEGNQYIFVSEVSNSCIDAYRINQSDGSLTWINDVASATWPVGMAVSTGEGHYLYAADFISGVTDGIRGYEITHASGALVEMPGSPFATGGTSSDAVAIDPSGAYLYCANYSSANLSAFRIKADYTLEFIATYACGANPRDLAVIKVTQ